MIDQVGTAFETRDAQPSWQRHSRTYSLFGLAISSAVPLPCPELREGCVAIDVKLQEATEQQIAALFTCAPVTVDDDGFWLCRTYPDGAARVYWRDHFEFAVSSDGRRVLWQKCFEVPHEVLFTYLLGQVLSFCLLARGYEQLHATAVVIEGAAIALLGGCGYGKSTLAATFLSRGYPLLTDDVLVLEFGEPAVLTHPSIARIKLTPDSATAFFQDFRAIPMNLLTSKKIFPLSPAQHVSQKIPLRSIYLLPHKTAASAVTIRRVKGRAAFLPLIRNTFNDSVIGPERLKQQFAFASRLARLVPIKRLAYPKRFDMLPAVVEAIVTDVQRELRRGE